VKPNLTCLLGLVVMILLAGASGDTGTSVTPTSAPTASSAETPHEQRLADLKKKRESLYSRAALEREVARMIARDAIKLSMDPLPDPDERRFLMEKMDEEEKRVAELVEQVKLIDAEIAREEQPTREQASASERSAVSGPEDAASPQVAQPGQCLSYAPAAVTLVGALTSKTFPGRPNYESVEKGDEPETYWILNLAQPICTIQSQDGSHGAAHDVSALQLLFTKSEMYQTYRSLLDTNVKVTGSLFSAETAHHHTPVMLQVASMESVQVP
jgi:hypothetical protein